VSTSGELAVNQLSKPFAELTTEEAVDDGVDATIGRAAPLYDWYYNLKPHIQFIHVIISNAKNGGFHCYHKQ